ncbi:glycosyltransferase family 39 protein [Candidatus Woesearchaeota archaeon]|nr:glycosyltransferase family 39 protein [Candidatus Woesearchaeota archaeon]
MPASESLQKLVKTVEAVKPKRTQEWILIALLVIVLTVKLYFVLQSPVPAYDAYYGIRQIEHIHQTGFPLFVDDLSYQGRITYSGIVFYTILAGVAVFIPTLLLFKYGSIIFGLLVLFLVYKITQRVTKDRWVALLTTIIAALSPSILTTHLNTLLPSTLFAVLYLLLIFFFFESSKKKFITWLIIAFVGAMLISSLTLVFVAGFGLYLLLLKLESLAVRKREFEFLIFSSVLIIWFHLLLYKPLFFQYGSTILWKTMPRELVVSTLQGLTVPLAVSLVGIVPLLLGIHTIYRTLFVQRSRLHLFLTSLAFVFSIITWFGFLPLAEGLFYTTLTFILLSGPAIKQLHLFTKKTIIPHAKFLFLVGFFILVILNFLPVLIYQDTITQQAPSLDEVNVFTSLDGMLPLDATVLGHITEGHLISAQTHRKNFYDMNFILAPNAQQRYTDAKTIFLSQSQTTVLKTLQRYGITHVLITPLTIQDYPKAKRLFENSNCFLPIYEWKEVSAYEVKCRVND